MFGHKEPNKMFKRLRNLRISLFNQENLKDFSDLESHHYQCVFHDGDSREVLGIFHSTYGDRSFWLKDYYNEGKIIFNYYTDDTHPCSAKKMFVVEATKKDVVVKPMMTIDGLNADSISLAIYEIERSVQDQLGSAQEILSYHNEQIERLK